MTTVIIIIARDIACGSVHTMTMRTHNMVAIFQLPQVGQPKHEAFL